MYKSVVYQGEVVLGEVEVYPEENNYKNFHVKEIRISHFSQPSERCSPLAVLHTVTSCGVCFKMESKTQQQDGLFHLHSLCIRENKLFFVSIGHSCLSLKLHVVISNNVFFSTQFSHGILTMVMMWIRDTSVLVRLRPAWEDLRSYLTARGRKRFEVYVCTMAERDYALEMWRLLDPDSNLINSKELLGRIVCVKSGLKKSLFNVFQDGLCHPKMALVIDDRLKVWDEKDQPRVHVVPAFAPYYAPQAEASNTIPVLCVARNVACNVRGGFFKDFDDGLLQKISQVAHEDDIKDIPSPPDVSNYLVSEDDGSISNGNRDPFLFDGMADAEVERKLKDALSAASTIPVTTTNLDPRLTSLQYTMVSSGSVPPSTAQASMMPFPHVQFPQPATTLVKPMGQAAPSESSLHSSPAREEGEVPESELDPDTRRRLLILQHGQDTRDHASSEPPFPIRHPVQVSVPRVPSSRGGWFPGEEEIGSQPLNRMYHRDERPRLNHALSSYRLSGDDIPFSRSSSSHRDLDSESSHSVLHADTPAVVLQEIALKCGTKVEFMSSLVSSAELQFSIEAWFSGKKVGHGFGRTRKEAQHKAAEDSIKHLADIYLSSAKDEPGSTYGDVSGFPNANDNGYMGMTSSLGNQSLPKEDSASFSTASDPSRVLDPRLEVSKRSMGSISALKELCMMEGLGVNFLPTPAPVSTNSVQKDEVHAQVEIDGKVFGKGIGLTWDEARTQAAEKALGSLRSKLGQSIQSQRRQNSPRSHQGFSNKRLKQEYPRTLQRVPSSARYPRNAPPIP
uniref:protein-serine/threonine phosphatase n=1 Tax=Cajanus cajan TaxID=3821 RepID=A0A151T224_CAJCA|nr:hypothetical protein KK1_023455 [Cajanus cajan]